MVVIDHCIPSIIIQANSSEWLPEKNCSFNSQVLATEGHQSHIDDGKWFGNAGLRMGMKELGTRSSERMLIVEPISNARVCRSLAPVASSTLGLEESVLSEQGDMGGNCLSSGPNSSFSCIGENIKRLHNNNLSLVMSPAIEDANPLAEASDWVLLKIGEVSKVVGLSFKGLEEET